jgi:hypothetical protein
MHLKVGSHELEMFAVAEAVFFDNVGGEVLDAVLTRLARGARIHFEGLSLEEGIPSPCHVRTSIRGS